MAGSPIQTLFLTHFCCPSVCSRLVQIELPDLAVSWCTDWKAGRRQRAEAALQAQSALPTARPVQPACCSFYRLGWAYSSYQNVKH